MQPISKNYSRNDVHITINVHGNQPELMRLLISWEGDKRFLTRDDATWLFDCLALALADPGQLVAPSHPIRALLDARVQRLRERKFHLHDYAYATSIDTPLGTILGAAFKAEKDNLEEEGRFLEQVYKLLEEE